MTVPERYVANRNVRRDAWRIQLFHEQIVEEAAARQQAQAMRRAVWLGVALGILGSLALSL